MGILDFAKDVGSAGVGLMTGGLAGDERFGTLDNIVEGAGDYFMADARAAREQQKAARSAEQLVGEGYDQGIDALSDARMSGVEDFNDYRRAVNRGDFSTDPNQFLTGQYQAQQYGGNAPQFNPYQMTQDRGYQSFQQGQDPGFQSFQRGQDPSFNNFQRGQDPTFQKFQRGRDLGFQSFQRGQGPEFNQFQRGQGPSFERADAGNFDFDYQASPGYQFARDEGIKSIEGRASAQGRRFAGGTDKEIAEYASGLAAQDYGNQYNRARGAFEADRGFGAGQAQQANQFGQRGYEFGTGIDAQQQAMANQFGQRAFEFGAGQDLTSNLARNQALQNQSQFGTGIDAQQQNLMNQANIGNYQFGTGVDQRQANLGSQFGQQNYQFGTGQDMAQNLAANQYGQNAFQFGENMGFADNQAMNQYGQNAFQYGNTLMAGQNNLANQQAANNYWTGQGMNQADRQFGFNANLGANQQNYAMAAGQNAVDAGLAGGLADYGYQSNINLANAQIGRGEAMANAALGVGNANANRAMSTRNTVNDTLNAAAQVAGAYKGVAG